MIFIIHLFIFASFAQWIDMPECPYGMQYVGNVCQNAFGQTACPVGYYFDGVQGKCTGQTQTNNNCLDGSTATLNDFGQPTCETNTDAALASSTNERQNSQESRSQPPSKLRACESAHTRAKRTCQPTATQTPNRLLQLSNQFAVFKNTGNILQACESARDIASLNFATNVKFSVQCLSSAKSCASACDTTHAPAKEREELKNLASECSSYQTASDQGVQQAQFDAATFLKSKACVEVASGDCKGPNAQYITSCLQYCAQNNNKSTAQCKVANQGCSNPEFYQENYTFCECLKNPIDSNCNQIRFSDLKTSSLSSKDQSILASINTTKDYSDESNDLVPLEFKNQKHSELPSQRKLNQANNLPLLNSQASAAQNTQGSSTANETSKEQPSYSGTSYNGYPSPQAHSTEQNAELMALHNFDYENYEQRTLRLKQEETQQRLEEKQILARAFKGGRNNITTQQPLIYVQEAERVPASEETTRWNSLFNLRSLIFTLLMFCIYKTVRKLE